jgi:hypothetical protein
MILYPKSKNPKYHHPKVYGIKKSAIIVINVAHVPEAGKYPIGPNVA